MQVKVSKPTEDIRSGKTYEVSLLCLTLKRKQLRNERERERSCLVVLPTRTGITGLHQVKVRVIIHRRQHRSLWQPDYDLGIVYVCSQPNSRARRIQCQLRLACRTAYRRLSDGWRLGSSKPTGQSANACTPVNLHVQISPHHRSAACVVCVRWFKPQLPSQDGKKRRCVNN